MAEFGYHTIGGTNGNAGAIQSMFCCAFTSGSDTGTITQVSAYLAGSGVAVKCAIYADSSGQPGAKLAESSQTKTPGAAAWQDWTDFSYVASPSTVYWLVTYCNNAGSVVNWYWDTGTTNQFWRRATGLTYPTFPDPAGTADAQAALQLSYYAVYTPAAPTAAITGTATAGITETDIQAGGKTIIITLTGDTWIA